MGFAEGIGVAVCIIISYAFTHEITIAIISGLVFLGFVTKGENGG